MRSTSGAVYRGANVENAAYPLGNCAETSAIAAGVAAEGARFRIAEIAVWATDDGGRVLACSPCGGCRQRIQELAVDDQVNVHFPWQGGETRTTSIGELLPFAFSLPAAPRKMNPADARLLAALDLTSLGEDDTPAAIQALCARAAASAVRPAAVCVFSEHIVTARAALEPRPERPRSRSRRS